jgi:hypothetical protein
LNSLLFHNSAITSKTVLGLKKEEDVSQLVDDEDAKDANGTTPHDNSPIFAIASI